MGLASSGVRRRPAAAGRRAPGSSASTTRRTRLSAAGGIARACPTLAPRAFDEIRTGGGWPAADPWAVVISPGVPPAHPRLQALPAGVPVMGEMELASRYCAAPIVAVTGTNGKSTVTEWIAHLARAGGRRAEAVGNVGRPLSLVARELGPDDLAVAEVSSFQLEAVQTFAPRVGAVLNLAPDHLDRYPDLAAYFAAKRVLAGRIPAGRRLRHLDRLPRGAGLAHRRPPRPLRRRRRRAPYAGEDDVLVDAAGGTPRPRAPGRAGPDLAAQPAQRPGRRGLRRRRGHRRPRPWPPACATSAGLPHRHQPVGRRGGVVFIDDSKATNVHAVCGGLAGWTGSGGTDRRRQRQGRGLRAPARRHGPGAPRGGHRAGGPGHRRGAAGPGAGQRGRRPWTRPWPWPPTWPSPTPRCC